MSAQFNISVPVYFRQQFEGHNVHYARNSPPRLLHLNPSVENQHPQAADKGVGEEYKSEELLRMKV